MTIIAFGGRIASGKTFVSRGVAAKLEAPWVSFGDAVRAEATARGLGPSRTILQNLGDELIAEGWPAFCARVVAVSDWRGRGLLVVDGVRHDGAIDALAELASPSRMLLVFVDASPERRYERLLARGVTGDEARMADGHPNEADVERVRERADIVVGNDWTVGDAADPTTGTIARVRDALANPYEPGAG